MKILHVKGSDSVVDDDIFEFVKNIKWHLNKAGYICYSKNNNKVFLHRLIANTPDGYVTDHINGNKLDNLRSNLRVTTDKYNRINSGMRSDNSSGFRGVWYRKNRKRWQSEIKIDGKKYSLGCYSTPEEAASAYNKKAIELFGTYARLNEIVK